MRRWVVVLLMGIFMIGNVIATYVVFTSRYPGANDFASRWSGARAFWCDGLSPYSEEATRQAQMLLHGRLISPEEERQQHTDPGLFVYPFYTVFLLWPLVWLSYPWAQATWLVILELCLGGGLLLALRIHDWRPPRWLLAFTVAWAFFFYPGARALILGQFAVFVFAMVALTLWGLKTRRDVLAGLCLALSTVKPQMIFLLVALLLVWAVQERRFRFVSSFLGGMTGLAVASWIADPDWVGGLIRQVVRYPNYTPIGSPIWIITHVAFPALGVGGEVTLSALAIVFLIGAAWWALRKRTMGWFEWAVGLCLIITNLVALRTATTNYVILLLPLVMVFRALQRVRGAWWVLLVEIVLLVGLWALFLTTLVGKSEHPVVYLPLPFGLLAVFVPGGHWLVRER